MTKDPPPKRGQRRAAIVARIKGFGRRKREDGETGPTAQRVAISVSLYFLIGLGISAIDPTYLMAAWLFGAALGLSVWYASQSKKRPVVNVYTVFFALGALGCLAGFVVRRGWPI
jgi:hypothetical protein